MSGKLHFTSGKELAITEQEMRKMITQLKNGGIRLAQTSKGHFIVLNSNTMEYIEYIPEVLEVDEEDKAIVKSGVTVQKVQEAREEVESAEDLAARKKKAMEDLMNKSNCKHEADKLELYVQQTAKGARYFPVCSFCGKRERYVSEKKITDGAYAGTVNEKWTLNDIETAKPWIED